LVRNELAVRDGIGFRERLGSVRVIAVRGYTVITSTIEQGVAVAISDVEQLAHAVDALPEQSPLRAFVADFLQAVTRGAGVALVEQDKELTPNDVAKLLNVSHPHVMKMIRVGALKSHQTGAHNRVLYSDFVDFAKRRSGASKYVAETIAAAQSGSAPALSDEALDQL